MRGHRSKTPFLAAACFVSASVLSACHGSTPPSASSSARPVHLSLPSDSGDLVTLPLTGRTTVIDAWSPSCAPCRETVPALLARTADIEAAGGKIVLVAVLADGETTENARTTLSSWGVSQPFLVDRGEVLRREAGVGALPATLLLAPSGDVRWTAPPAATADDVVAAVRSAQ